jgi:hypothetical protein
MVQQGFETRVTRLSGRLRRGEISLAAFQREFKGEVKDLATVQTAIGKGDWRAVTKREWGRVGAELRWRQYNYAKDFGESIHKDVQEGKELGPRIDWRAKLYKGAGTKAFWQAVEAEQELPLGKLPGYPAQDTLCDGNCKCAWSIQKVDGGWRATWVMSVAEHCDTCIERAGEWNNLFIPREG